MGKDLKLQLSVEHSGFRFEAKPETAVNLLQYHIGGKAKEFKNVTCEYFPKEIAAQGASSAMDDGIAIHPVLEVLETSVAHLYYS